MLYVNVFGILCVTVTCWALTPLTVSDCSSSHYNRRVRVNDISIVQDAVRVPANVSLVGSVEILQPITDGIMVDVTIKMWYSWWYGYYTVLSRSLNLCDLLAGREGACPLESLPGNNNNDTACLCPFQPGTIDLVNPYTIYIPTQQGYMGYLNDITIKLRDGGRYGRVAGCTDVEFYVNPYKTIQTEHGESVNIHMLFFMFMSISEKINSVL